MGLLGWNQRFCPTRAWRFDIRGRWVGTGVERRCEKPHQDKVDPLATTLGSTPQSALNLETCTRERLDRSHVRRIGAGGQPGHSEFLEREPAQCQDRLGRVPMTPGAPLTEHDPDIASPMVWIDGSELDRADDSVGLLDDACEHRRAVCELRIDVRPQRVWGVVLEPSLQEPGDRLVTKPPAITIGHVVERQVPQDQALRLDQDRDAHAGHLHRPPEHRVMRASGTRSGPHRVGGAPSGPRSWRNRPAPRTPARGW